MLEYLFGDHFAVYSVFVAGASDTLESAIVNWLGRVSSLQRARYGACMVKPAVFIGSSTEGLEFARAVRAQLDPDAEVTLWNDEGTFKLGDTFIESLINALPRFDFAILMLTPDDLVAGRNQERFGPRDNVIFELGLFMSRLGRSRTFIVHQSNTDIKIPSDLSGVSTARYAWPREDGNHGSAVGAASDSIRRAIRELGFSDAKAAVAIGNIRNRQDSQEARLVSQENQIRSLQFSLANIVTSFEVDKLIGLASDAPFTCRYSDDLYNELKHLRAIGFVANYPDKGLGAIREQFSKRSIQFDLKSFFFITEQGSEYMRLRAEVLR